MAIGEWLKRLAACPNLSVELNLGVLEALVVAASHSNVEFVRIACYIVPFPAVMCAVIFGWMLFAETKPRRQGTSTTPVV